MSLADTRTLITPFRHRLYRLLLLACSALFPALAIAAVDASADSYLLQLQQTARQQQLARQAAWLDLLHVKPHPLSGRQRSLADDPGFFLAVHGQEDPAAELDATLAAFFSTDARHALQQTAQCRFVARYQWLRQQLQFDPSRLPEQACSRYQDWRTGLDAASVTLVFPAAYVNSPASMYGHTFLRINPASRPKDPLLSYAISYAAAGNEAEGMLFAFKGLAGLYPGIFTNAPYYLKIRDYSDLENRDIWEYDLALQPAELDRLLAHTWELGVTRFDYFFFDENCAYHLLSLLDVARPGLKLTDRFTWWAMPVDTVRAVAASPSLLAGIRYRPSNGSELTHRAELLPVAAVDAGRRLGDGELQPTAYLAAGRITASEQAAVLELAERYVAYQAARGILSPQIAEQRRFQLLAARAPLPPLQPEPVPPRPATTPEAGHGTGRIDLAIGSRNGAAGGRLTLRPAYHDLTDPDTGFQPGAQIQFFQVEASLIQGEAARLERFTPVDIVSLAPDQGLQHNTSWKVRFGLARPPTPAAPLAIEANGGPGQSWRLANHALGYAFLDNQLWIDRTLDRGWAIGSGPLLGLLWEGSQQQRLKLEWASRWHAGSRFRDDELRLINRWSLTRDDNIDVDCRYRRRDDASSERECWLAWQRYW